MDESHQEAIENFCAITNSWDIEIAIAYLSNHNWDVSTASNEFLGAPGPAVANPPDPVIPNPQPGYLSRAGAYLSSLFSPILNFFMPSAPQNPFLLYLQGLNLPNPPHPTALGLEATLPFAADRNKLVLIYVHQSSTSDVFVRNVLCSREASVIINEYFILWGCMGETEEGAEIIGKFSNEQSVVFAVIDPRTTETLNTLEYVPRKEELLGFLHGFVPANVENSEIQAVQDRVIREQQEKEFREAERLAIRKAEEDRRKVESANKEREEAEYRKMMEEEEKRQKLSSIGEEPEAGAGVTQITFRLPSGEKIERRFHCDTSIEVLYTFIEIKGYSNAEIVSGFPSKVLSEGTLQSEGLTPRGLIHVRLSSV